MKWKELCNISHCKIINKYKSIKSIFIQIFVFLNLKLSYSIDS